MYIIVYNNLAYEVLNSFVTVMYQYVIHTIYIVMFVFQLPLTRLQYLCHFSVILTYLPFFHKVFLFRLNIKINNFIYYIHIPTILRLVLS